MKCAFKTVIYTLSAVCSSVGRSLTSILNEQKKAMNSHIPNAVRLSSHQGHIYFKLRCLSNFVTDKSIKFWYAIPI